MARGNGAERVSSITIDCPVINGHTSDSEASSNNERLTGMNPLIRKSRGSGMSGTRRIPNEDGLRPSSQSSAVADGDDLRSLQQCLTCEVAVASNLRSVPMNPKSTSPPLVYLRVHNSTHSC